MNTKNSINAIILSAALTAGCATSPTTPQKSVENIQGTAQRTAQDVLNSKSSSEISHSYIASLLNGEPAKQDISFIALYDKDGNIIALKYQKMSRFVNKDGNEILFHSGVYGEARINSINGQTLPKIPEDVLENMEVGRNNRLVEKPKISEATRLMNEDNPNNSNNTNGINLHKGGASLTIGDLNAYISHSDVNGTSLGVEGAMKVSDNVYAAGIVELGEKIKRGIGAISVATPGDGFVHVAVEYLGEKRDFKYTYKEFNDLWVHHWKTEIGFTKYFQEGIFEKLGMSITNINTEDEDLSSVRFFKRTDTTLEEYMADMRLAGIDSKSINAEFSFLPKPNVRVTANLNYTKAITNYKFKKHEVEKGFGGGLEIEYLFDDCGRLIIKGFSDVLNRGFEVTYEWKNGFFVKVGHKEGDGMDSSNYAMIGVKFSFTSLFGGIPDKIESSTRDCSSGFQRASLPNQKELILKTAENIKSHGVSVKQEEREREISKISFGNLFLVLGEARGKNKADYFAGDEWIMFVTDRDRAEELSKRINSGEKVSQTEIDLVTKSLEESMKGLLPKNLQAGASLLINATDVANNINKAINKANDILALTSVYTPSYLANLQTARNKANDLKAQLNAAMTTLDQTMGKDGLTASEYNGALAILNGILQSVNLKPLQDLIDNPEKIPTIPAPTITGSNSITGTYGVFNFKESYPVNYTGKDTPVCSIYGFQGISTHLSVSWNSATKSCDFTGGTSIPEGKYNGGIEVKTANGTAQTPVTIEVGPAHITPPTAPTIQNPVYCTRGSSVSLFTPASGVTYSLVGISNGELTLDNNGNLGCAKAGTYNNIKVKATNSGLSVDSNAFNVVVTTPSTPPTYEAPTFTESSDTFTFEHGLHPTSKEYTISNSSKIDTSKAFCEITGITGLSASFSNSKCVVTGWEKLAIGNNYSGTLTITTDQGSDSISLTGSVTAPSNPNNPPTISLGTHPSSVPANTSSVDIPVQLTDPDAGDTIVLKYKVNGGTAIGVGTFTGPINNQEVVVNVDLSSVQNGNTAKIEFLIGDGEATNAISIDITKEAPSVTPPSISDINQICDEGTPCSVTLGGSGVEEIVVTSSSVPWIVAGPYKDSYKTFNTGSASVDDNGKTYTYYYKNSGGNSGTATGTLNVNALTMSTFNWIDKGYKDCKETKRGTNFLELTCNSGHNHILVTLDNTNVKFEDGSNSITYTFQNLSSGAKDSISKDVQNLSGIKIDDLTITINTRN